ncbi:hypothetical protein [Comamonas sp.]|uniref:hypothetical protein n=1 Tax=Comamonas sp. TaxID=34028 RepID=UPI00289A6C72|nr:hypothetical protein [Comamonas sp.]
MQVSHRSPPSLRNAGISLLATGAVVHVSGLALGFFSPVRMSIAAKFSHGAAQERRSTCSCCRLR